MERIILQTRDAAVADALAFGYEHGNDTHFFPDDSHIEDGAKPLPRPPMNGMIVHIEDAGTPSEEDSNTWPVAVYVRLHNGTSACLTRFRNWQSYVDWAMQWPVTLDEEDPEERFLTALDRS